MNRVPARSFGTPCYWLQVQQSVIRLLQSYCFRSDHSVFLEMLVEIHGSSSRSTFLTSANAIAPSTFLKNRAWKFSNRRRIFVYASTFSTVDHFMCVQFHSGIAIPQIMVCNNPFINICSCWCYYISSPVDGDKSMYCWVRKSTWSCAFFVPRCDQIWLDAYTSELMV